MKVIRDLGIFYGGSNTARLAGRVCEVYFYWEKVRVVPR